MTPFLRGAALVALLVPPAALLAADGASGSFRHDKTTVKPADALAFTTPVDGKPLTIVAVTDFKLDRQAVLDAIDPASGVLEQVHDGRNVVFLRLASATACGVYAYLSGTAQSMDLGNSFPSHPRTATASRVAGDCGTTAPQESFDVTYEFTLAYDLPVTPVPPATALPAGGGEPGAGFVALVKAIAARDVKTALAHVPAGEAPTTPDANWFEGLALNYPKQATVKEGLAKGARARFEIAGLDHDGKKIKGTVEMRKEQASWRVSGLSLFFDQ